MVVLDRFYEIVEKPSYAVSKFHKVVHVSLFATIIAAGAMSTYSFSAALDGLSGRCFLNPVSLVFYENRTLNVSGDVHHPERFKEIDNILSVWGPKKYCDFAQFVPLASVIAGTIWGMFFMILSHGGAGLPSDILSPGYRIIYPCAVFTLAFSLLYLANLIKLTVGHHKFCKMFTEDHIMKRCGRDLDQYTLQLSDDNTLRPFSHYVDLYKSTIHIGTGAWVAQFVMLIHRIVRMVDFDLYYVTISEKQEERVENVIDLTTPSTTAVCKL